MSIVGTRPPLISETNLYEPRHKAKMTQQEISDITGIKPSNLARFESGGRVPTLIVLEKWLCFS